MPIKHEMITLSDQVPTLITDDGDDLYYYVELTIQNVDESAEVYIGVDNLSTSSYGMVLKPGVVISLTKISYRDKLYAISDTNGCKIALLKTSTLSKDGR